MSEQPTSWPYEEARALIARMEQSGKDIAILETGYGPSGLPHIGTFAEVVRTSYVKRAFEELTGQHARIIVFSDDMDALRSVPDNIPNKELLENSLNLPLTEVPDPYGTYASFAHHNNEMLMRFLSECGFVKNRDYVFASSTDMYKNGTFNRALHRMAEVHDEIVAIVAPTLGEERRASWSPFMPIHPETGRVMMVPIKKVNIDDDTIEWEYEGKNYRTSILFGHCKIQWKADWALRWFSFGVDYEMSGKDLIDSVKLSSRICRVLGGTPPINLTYELFLDIEGKKISKSKGNGVSVDQWLEYSDIETLSHVIFAKPRVAKKVSVSMIPKASEDFIANITRLTTQTPVQQRNNPAWFVLNGRPASEFTPVTGMQMLVNLANVANSSDPRVIESMVTSYRGDLDPYTMGMVKKAAAFYRDTQQGNKVTREPTAVERDAIADLIETLSTMEDGRDGEYYQFEVYEVGKRHEFASLRDWFKGLYEVLLGESDGPRFGHFIAIYGRQRVIDLLKKVI